MTGVQNCCNKYNTSHQKEKQLFMTNTVDAILGVWGENISACLGQICELCVCKSKTEEYVKFK